MPQFSLRSMVGLVTAAGIAYAIWYAVVWQGDQKDRARVCCVNQNLIDRYIGLWEARTGYLDLTRGLVVIELDTAGTITKATPGLALKEGSNAIALAAKDDAAFFCPETGASNLGPAVHYRWISSPTPLRELTGRRRGTVCLIHGERGPSPDPQTRHAW